jgi:glutamate synthase domain-containing protein 1
MSETNSSNVKEGTFAAAILNTYGPLNTKDKFKEKYADKSFKILLNPKDGNYAALIAVNKGIIAVEGIENQDKKSLDQDTLGWDGFMQTSLALFDEIGKGNLSQNDIVKKVVARKIKIKNPKIVAKLAEMLACMNE